MQQYEFMVVVRPDMDLKDEKGATDMIQNLVGEAKVSDVTIMGKKHLAYPIQKLEEGVYVLSTITGLLKTNEIEKRVRLSNGVLRYLLLAKA